jgi:anti-sigma B factor antagonist
MLTLQTFAQDNATVVKCSGKLVAGVTGILYDEVKPLIPRTKRIVLDLTDLTQMDSLGLGTIVGLYVSAKAAGCDLKLINLSKRVRELFSITNLLSLFEVYGEHPTKIP